MLLIVSAATAAGLAGCQPADEVRRYQVPREQPAAPLKRPATTKPSPAGPQRMLVGMFPRPDSVWFFRLDGPEAQVTELKDAFEKLVRSIKFTGKADDPVIWTLPEGWKQEPAPKGSLRYATLRVGTLEGRVARLGRESGTVLQNLERFRGEVGLPEPTEADLAKDAKPIEVDGTAGTWIDITGPGGGKGMR